MMPLTFQALGSPAASLAQVQDHAGAALGALDGLDLEVTGAAADPAHALGSLLPARRDSTVIRSATMKPE